MNFRNATLAASAQPVFCSNAKNDSIAMVSLAAPIVPIDPKAWWQFRTRTNCRGWNCEPQSELTQTRHNPNERLSGFATPANSMAPGAHRETICIRSLME